MARQPSWRWIAAALLFSATVLPFLVYFTGTMTLGPYANGGPWRFLGDFYGDLARLRAAAWTLLLGPVVLVLVLRVVAGYAWQGTGNR
jgi:hypothetical protein